MKKLEEVILQKRRVSLLVPYCRKDGMTTVYLQRRSQDAPMLPGNFGFWGGGAHEDESPMDTLRREIREELEVEICEDQVCVLNFYEFLLSVKTVYMFLCEEAWAYTTTIREGDYGEWLVLNDGLFARHDISLQDKVVLNDIERKMLDMPIR